MTNSDLAHKAMVESIATPKEPLVFTRLLVPASNPDVVVTVPEQPKPRDTKRWIDRMRAHSAQQQCVPVRSSARGECRADDTAGRSEEHTSELQSH